MLSLNPAYGEGHRCLGACLLALGQNGPALDALRQAVKVGEAYAWAVATLAAALAYLGDTDEAERMLADLEQRAIDDWISPMSRGLVHAALGRTDAAIAALERSIEEREPWVVGLAVEPAWDSIRGTPRFEALIAKIDFTSREQPRPALGAA